MLEETQKYEIDTYKKNYVICIIDKLRNPEFYLCLRKGLFCLIEDRHDVTISFIEKDALFQILRD